MPGAVGTLRATRSGGLSAATRASRSGSATAPGFSIRRVGGHTPGMQIVRLMTRRGWVVVASDAMHFYANRETAVPFAILVDVPDYMAAWQVLDRLADSPDHIIPGHDPRVRAIYPPAKPGLEGTAVRLDVMPAGPRS